MMNYAHYWLAKCIWLGSNTAYGFIFLCLFTYTLKIGSRNYGMSVLRWMSITSMMYILGYVIGYTLLLLYAIGGYIYNNSNDGPLLPSEGSLPVGYIIAYYSGRFVFDGFGLIFITMMNFRLKETFQDTQYTLDHKIFVSIHMATFMAFIMIILYEIIDISETDTIYSKNALVFLCIYILIDLLIEAVLMYTFAMKLYKVNRLKAQVYDSNSGIDTNTDSNYMSRLLIESSTRQCLLSIIAMICECTYLFGTLIRYLLRIQDAVSLEYNIATWYIAIIPTWIKILCIYLSFGYTSNSYDRLCALCHHELKNYCRNAVWKHIKANEYEQYDQL